MKPILLLGANFVRSQFLLLAIVLAYVVCLSSFLAFHEQLPDLIFFIRQQAIYGVGLGALVMVPALQNERKSRRVLSVLSKGIHRWQYLGGLLCGAIVVAGVFCLEVGLAAVWLARQASMPVTGLAELMLTLFFACAAGAATALFCSVFLHPLLALPATVMLLLFPYAAEMNGLHTPGYFFPVSATLRLVFNFTFQRPGSGLLPIGAAALIHVALFWMAAWAIFARQDVTVAPE
jgi:hypothetical protein